MHAEFKKRKSMDLFLKPQLAFNLAHCSALLKSALHQHEQEWLFSLN
jgi:hypothetical protein